MISLSFELTYLTKSGLYFCNSRKGCPFIIKKEKKYLHFYICKDEKLFPLFKLRNISAKEKGEHPVSTILGVRLFCYA